MIQIKDMMKLMAIPQLLDILNFWKEQHYVNHSGMDIRIFGKKIPPLLIFLKNIIFLRIIGDKNFEKIFKESYFQCRRVDYDGTIEEGGNTTDSGEGSGRIHSLYFDQIKKNE